MLRNYVGFWKGGKRNIYLLCRWNFVIFHSACCLSSTPWNIISKKDDMITCAASNSLMMKLNFVYNSWNIHTRFFSFWFSITTKASFPAFAFETTLSQKFSIKIKGYRETWNFTLKTTIVKGRRFSSTVNTENLLVYTSETIDECFNWKSIFICEKLAAERWEAKQREAFSIRVKNNEEKRWMIKVATVALGETRTKGGDDIFWKV